MDLKIKDVAELLNISETTVRRWLAEGKIPAYRIHHQYRFSRGEIQNWVMSHKLGCLQNAVISEDREEKTFNPGESCHPSGGIQQFSLYRAIYKGGIWRQISGNSKEEVIRNAMKPIADKLEVDAEGLAELLWDRERLQPTALNNGIGVPHTRDFLLKGSQDAVSVVFLQKPIDYGALDGKPVHTLFFLFACEDKRHLHLLAKIALFCSNEKNVDFLSTKPTKEAFLQYIKDWESAVPRRPLSDAT